MHTEAETGPWDEALATLREWDPAWAESCARMATNPWRSGVLPRRLVELIGVAVNAACTNLNPDGTRRHIRAASCSLGAPILMEEAKAAGAQPAAKAPASTPACDRMKAIGQWNTAWDPFYELDPAWTDEFMATGAGIYGSGLLSAKEVELLSIAFDASYTHMYAPGTRRHIHNALKTGATVEEIMEVLKLCVAQGVQACNLGVPILAAELERLGRAA